MGSANNEDEANKELNDSGYVQDDMSKPAEEYTGMAGLLDLSDDVLLLILRSCSPHDLKSLGFTCSRLSALVLDRSLWSSVDARQVPLGRQRMRWLIQRALGAHTHTLKLRGYADQADGCLGYMNSYNTRESTDENGSSVSAMGSEERYLCGGPRIYRLTQTIPSVVRYGGNPVSAPSSCPGPQLTLTHTALREMSLRCPNLTTLELDYCVIDCRTTNIGMFPKTLKKLSLRGTKCFNLEARSFLFKIQDHLVDLEELDVSYCNWIEPACMLPLSKIPKLRSLSMRECYKLAEFVAYASLATRYGFKELKFLDLRGSPVGDSEVSAVGWLGVLEELLLAPAPDPVRPTDHAHYTQDPLPPHKELEEWEEKEPDYFVSPRISEADWIRDEEDVRGNRSMYYSNCDDPTACILLERMVAEPVSPAEYSQVYHQFLSGHNSNVQLANPAQYRESYRRFMMRPTHGHPPAGYSLFIRRPDDDDELIPGRGRLGRTGNNDGQAGPSGIGEITCSCGPRRTRPPGINDVAGPSGSGAGPSSAAGPSGSGAGPSSAAGPSGSGAGPSSAAGPSGSGAGPSSAAGPSGSGAGPSSAVAGQSGSGAGPSGSNKGPSGSSAGPSSSAALSSSGVGPSGSADPSGSASPKGSSAGPSHFPGTSGSNGPPCSAAGPSGFADGPSGSGKSPLVSAAVSLGSNNLTGSVPSLSGSSAALGSAGPAGSSETFKVAGSSNCDEGTSGSGAGPSNSVAASRFGEGSSASTVAPSTSGETLSIPCLSNDPLDPDKAISVSGSSDSAAGPSSSGGGTSDAKPSDFPSPSGSGAEPSGSICPSSCNGPSGLTAGSSGSGEASCVAFPSGSAGLLSFPVLTGSSAGPLISDKVSSVVSPSGSARSFDSVGPSNSADQSFVASPAGSSGPSTPVGPSVSARPSSSGSQPFVVGESGTAGPSSSGGPSFVAGPSAVAGPSSSDGPSVFAVPLIPAGPSGSNIKSKSHRSKESDKLKKKRKRSDKLSGEGKESRGPSGDRKKSRKLKESDGPSDGPKKSHKSKDSNGSPDKSIKSSKSKDSDESPDKPKNSRKSDESDKSKKSRKKRPDGPKPPHASGSAGPSRKRGADNDSPPAKRPCAEPETEELSDEQRFREFYESMRHPRRVFEITINEMNRRAREPESSDDSDDEANGEACSDGENDNSPKKEPEPAAGNANEPAAEKAIEPAAGKANKAAAGNAKEPAAGKANKAAAGNANKPAAEKAIEPAAGKANKAAAGNAKEPAAGKANKAAAGNANVPAAGKANKAAAGNGKEPAAGKANKAAAGNAKEPAAGKANKPAAGKANKPAAGNANLPAAGNANVPAARNANVPAARNANVPAAGNNPANPNPANAAQNETPRVYQFRQYRRPIVIEEYINVADPDAPGVLPRGVLFPGSPTRLDHSALISDSSIRRFGRAIGENINYIHIGGVGADGNARPDRSSLRFLSVTGFRHVTDASLEHLATAAPFLERVDFTGTSVTAAGVKRFRELRPEVQVIFSETAD